MIFDIQVYSDAVLLTLLIGTFVVVHSISSRNFFLNFDFLLVIRTRLSTFENHRSPCLSKNVLTKTCQKLYDCFVNDGVKVNYDKRRMIYNT